MQKIEYYTTTSRQNSTKFWQINDQRSGVCFRFNIILLPLETRETQMGLGTGVENRGEISDFSPPPPRYKNYGRGG